jgi:outer membrane biosynthesis protein TonB
VTAFLGPEGRWIALRIQAIPEAPTWTPEPTRTPEEIQETSTPTSTPTRTRPPTRTPGPTATPIPAPAPTAIPSPTAPETSTPTPRPTETPRPTPTPEDHDKGDTVEWKGILQAIAGSTWVIDGRAVQVTSDTRIRGSPRVGDRVEVKARRQPDGTLVALEIERKD